LLKNKQEEGLKLWGMTMEENSNQESFKKIWTLMAFITKLLHHIRQSSTRSNTRRALEWEKTNSKPFASVWLRCLCP
jgi:hypothetical protein